MKGTLEFVLETARAVMASLAVSYEVETGKAQNIDELKCMAENIYFEGRAEPMIGKIAIGQVVMNRIQDEISEHHMRSGASRTGQGELEDQERPYPTR